MPVDIDQLYANATPFGRRVFDSANSGKRYDLDWLEREVREAELSRPATPELPDPALQMPGVPSQAGALEAMGVERTPAPATAPQQPVAPLPTVGELRAAELAAADREVAGFWDLAGTAFNLDSSTGNAIDWMDGSRYYYDPEFSATEYAKTPEVKARIDALVGADMDEVGTMLGESMNQDHFDFFLARMERDRDDERMLAEAGAKGFAARMIAALGDPIDLAVTAAVAPIGGAVKLTRLGRAIKAATAAGIANGAIETFAAINNPYRDGRDIAFATAAGFAIGGPLGMLGRADNARLRVLYDTMAKQDADDVAARVVDSVPDEAGNTRLDSVGSRRRVLEGDGPLLERTDLGAGMEAPEFGWGWAQRLQRNYIGRLLHNTTDITRKYANRIIEGGFLVDRKATRAFTAEGRAGNLFRTYTTKFYRDSGSDFNAWAARNGYNQARVAFGSEAGERFYTQVGVALRGGERLGDGTAVSTEAAAAAGKIRPLLDEYHKMASEVGLPGFADREPLDNFFPRSWADGKIAALREEIGASNDNVLGKWFKESILSRQDDLEEAVAERIGMGFARAIVARGATLDDLINHGIPLTDLQRARELLGEIEGVDEIIETLQKINAANAEQAGKTRHGKQRLRLDENYDGAIRLADGTERRLTLDDMTITDARKVIPRYFQTMGGAIALAKEAGIRSEGDIDRVIREMVAAGESTDAQQALRDVINLVRGVSVERDPYTGVSQLSRLAASYDYVRFGGQFGFASLPEIGNIIGEAGVLTFMRNVPMYRDFLSRAADGRLKLEAAREIEELLAPGTDWIRNPAVSSFDEQGLGFDTRTVAGKVGNAVDAPLQRMARVTQAVSLMAPIVSALERIASFEIANSWMKAARGLKKVSETRLRAAGLSATDWNAITKAMREHGTMERGRLKSLNTDKWDAGTRDKFILALDRERSFNIQRNLIGNTGRYIHHPIGRMLTRFMTFMLNSVNQQLIRGLHHRDIQTFVSWSTSMMLGSMVYVAQTSIDYANDDKRRRERLEPRRIAAAAWQRAGFAAVTVPVIDSALAATGFDPIFKYGRTSGLGTDLISGNTTITGVKDLAATATLPFRLLHEDYEFSQTDAERIQRLTPFQRMLGIKNAFHAITEDLPRESRPR